ncbi:alpha/beta fold hydrolase [Stutzerimonas azotifigens]|uniref:alpha/beta fold hydrolase n=1 Tax=Stutzerimonas azotifigens TaxID=291995 RepID=UPI000422B15D|nr:alpha/beta hydrolase [Stutzerimonas azotifigens]
MIGKMLLALSAAGLGLAWYSAGRARRAEARVPVDGGFVEVDGARLHYLDLRPAADAPARGPAIVMVHGLCGQLRNFTYSLAGELAQRHRVIVLDRPGSGYSSPAPGPFPGLYGQARLIARFIDALGLERPLLVGHSLGGAIVLALALDHPGCVGGLALIAPLTQPVLEPPKLLTQLAIASAPLRRLLAWTLAVPVGRLTQRRALRQAFAPAPVPADFAVRGGAELAMRPGNFFAASSDLCSAGVEMPLLAARYPSLTLPVEIIYGRGDRILDHRLHGERLLGRIPRLRLELVDGGHMLPVTHDAHLARWLEAAWQRAADEGAAAQSSNSSRNSTYS